MTSLIRQLERKRDKLNKRLGVVKSPKARRALQAELQNILEYLAIVS